jgi:hypothetical protein
MDNKAKEAILILILSLGIFWYFKPKQTDAANVDKNGIKRKYNKPDANDLDLSNPIVEDAYSTLCGYIDAYNDGLPQKDLDSLNKEFAKKFDMQVVNVGGGLLAVEDMKGNEILTSKV